MRAAFVFLHRWVGLAAGLLLALLGLTGTFMVWQAEIDAALNPQWFSSAGRCAKPARAQPIAASLSLLDRARPQARATTVVAPSLPGAAHIVWEARDEATGWRREHFVDPACGRYLGMRDRGAWRLDAAHAVPLLYDLHSRLVAGEPGHLVVGAGGLVLLALGLSGLVVAWPRGASGSGWRRALGIKTDASPVRLWYDIHRAFGLWLLPVVLLMSITGAGLVFSDTARALVDAVLKVERLPRMAGGAAAGPAPAQALPLDELAARAEQEFPAARWSRLTLPTAPAAPIEVRLLQAGEPRVDTGTTRVRFGADGKVLARYDALRTGSGSVVLDWLFPLHSGEGLGTTARLLWTAFGLMPLVWLGSGAWLWWRRRSRLRPAVRQRAAELVG